MIECLHIAETATYSSTGVMLNGLTKFNYFYGPNGSGKTSISRVIADPTQYSKCSVTWKGGNPTERLVYNRDFVERHFRAAAELPGIFTLGEKNAETIEKIEAAKLSCISISNEIITFTKSLQGEDGKGGKLGELVVTEDTFKDVCWKQKQEFEDRFRVAFAGFLRSALFKDKVLSEKQSNKAEVRPLDYILTRAELVFRDDVEQVALIPTISTGAFIDCESASILGKRVIGKSDVDIAAMIERLGILGGSANGRVEWRTKDGRTLKAIQEAGVQCDSIDG